jgi:tetratricopeptide (TPR) repeat protein
MSITRSAVVLTLLVLSTARPVLAADQAAVPYRAGMLQLARGEVRQAQATLEQFLATDETADATVPDSDRLVRRISTLNVVAALRHAQGDDETAERLLRRALVLDGAVRSPENEAEMAQTLTGLAQLAGSRGDFRSGLRLTDQALKRYARVVGPRRVDRVEPLVTRAGLETARGAFDAAESLLRTARRVAEHEQARPSLHSVAAMQFGALRLAQGRYGEAESMLEDAVEWAQEAMGVDHPAVLPSMEILAECYRRRGRIDDARALFQRVLRVAQQVYGPGSTAAQRLASSLAALDEPMMADRSNARAGAGRGGSAR